MPTFTRLAHWPEYAIEAGALGVFMVSAAIFTSLLEHPASPAYRTLPDPLARRLLMGLAMGGTAIAIIYSPFGARSGAHMNPATTFAFARLGKVAPGDALAYIAAQISGGMAGLWLAAAALGSWIADPRVNYVATVPGPWGAWPAFAAEVVISFVLMSTVLRVSNGPRARLTGLCAGALVAFYILVESPISGMSMNPARSLAPALLSGRFDALWIYFTAPPLGMLLAAELFARQRGLQAVLCAKLHHGGEARCIFRCTHP